MEIQGLFTDRRKRRFFLTPSIGFEDDSLSETHNGSVQSQPAESEDVLSFALVKRASGANSCGQTVDNDTRTIRANTVGCPRQGRCFQWERLSDVPSSPR